MIAARFGRDRDGSRSSASNINLNNRRRRALLSQKSNRQRQIQQNRYRAFESLLLKPTPCANTQAFDSSSVSVSDSLSMPMSLDESSKTQGFGKPISKARKGHNTNRYSKIEQQYAEEFQIPEWMIDVPEDLHESSNGQMQMSVDGGPSASNSSSEESGWFVIPRPEGTRCLVITRNGYTESRKKNGRILHHKFPSKFPNGSHSSRTKASEFCILDCIFQENLNTYFVLDLLCWKGQLMTECSAALRLFWLRSRISEVPGIDNFDQDNQFRFVTVPVYDCNLEGLQNAYNTQFSYVKDGLLFYNKAGHYSKGLTPLVLVWKDAKTSRFPVDSPDGVNPYPVQSCVLKLEQHDCVGMNPFEYFMVALGGDVVEKVPSEFVAKHHLQAGDFLRFTLSGASLLPEPESHGSLSRMVQVEEFVFQNKCGKNRKRLPLALIQAAKSFSNAIKDTAPSQ